MEDQFFVVWNPSHGLPRYQHATYEEAEAEAKRLALLNRGQRFIVMESCVTVTTDEPVKVIPHRDGIPF